MWEQAKYLKTLENWDLIIPTNNISPLCLSRDSVDLKAEERNICNTSALYLYFKLGHDIQ